VKRAPFPNPVVLDRFVTRRAEADDGYGELSLDPDSRLYNFGARDYKKYLSVFMPPSACTQV
jgi:hypothetical protein